MNAGCVIAAYQASGTLEHVLLKIFQFIPKENICVIDDGSTDKTGEVATDLGVYVIRHPSNMGKGAALRSGFHFIRKTGVTDVFVLDADGQHAPESIPDFMDIREKENADIVLGKRRFNIRTMPPDRILSNRISSLILSALTGYWIPDSQCGFRLFRLSVLEQLDLTTTHYDTESEILIQALRNGANVAYCPVESIYSGGKSHMNKWMDTGRFIKLVLQYLFKRS